MIKTRYILTLLTMLMCMVVGAQDFNPDSPPEPSARYRLTLKANPKDAGIVSGAGMYTVNSSVRLSATAASAKWKFKCWTDDEGEEVNASSSFYHRTANRAETLTAQFEPVATSLVTIAYDPSWLSKGETNEYEVGYTLNTYVSSFGDYTFENWTDSKGNVISTSRSLSYAVTSEDETFTAHYRYNPDSPQEPSETKPKHRVYFSSDPTSVNNFNQSSGFLVAEGSTFSIYAYQTGDYIFKGWTAKGNDALLTTSQTYSAVMGTEDVWLVANYEYSPTSPSEPSPDTKQRHTLYATTTTLYQGEKTLIPVYMENTGNVATLAFSLNLPDGLKVFTDEVQTTMRTSAYTVTASQNGSTLNVTLNGGTQISDHGGVVVRIPVVTENGFEDGDYAVTISKVEGTATDGTAITFTSRSGRIAVSTLEEGDLQAQFSVDRYMNRAQFTNLSSDNARSFEWDFGDGLTSNERNPLHQYAAPGTYTVRLTARGVVKTVTAEQNIIINPSSTWTAGGDYTLNPKAAGPRVFNSLHEMFELLSQCTPNGTINVKTGPQSEFTANLTHADSLALAATMAQKLADAGTTMAFTHDGDEPATFSFVANAADSDLQQVTGMLSHMTLSNVVVTLNGADIRVAEIGKYSGQTVCSGTPTLPEPLSAISSSPDVNVRWSVSVAAGCTVTGYTASGTGDLPSMTLDNSGSNTDLVTYHVDVTLSGAVILSYIYKVNVKPRLKSLALDYPADKAVLEYGNLNVSCRSAGVSAVGYTFHYRRTDSEGDGLWTELHNTSTYASFVPTEGATYEWYATAHGECGESVDSEHHTFSIRYRADLKVMTISVPQEVEANKEVTITAVIRNVGKGSTMQRGWTDLLSYKTSPEGGTTSLSTFNRSGALAPGEEYTATFTVTSPDASVGQIYYVVHADGYGRELESDETNNTVQSEAVAVIDRYIASDEYEALIAFYRATNGSAWTKTWRVGSNAITSTGWPGVTFDGEGHVVTISLSDNNLKGILPTEGITLPYLTALDLSRNSLKGDVATFSRQLPALTTLDLSHNLLTELTECLPPTITSLNLGYQCDARPLSTIELQGWAIGDPQADIRLGSLIAYDHRRQNFNAHPTLRLYAADGSGFAGEMRHDGTAYRYSLSDDYRHTSGAEFIVQPTEGAAAYTRLRTKLTWTSGDANADGSVDVLDAQQTLNYIMGTKRGNFNFAAADTYASNSINVQDVVSTINLFIADDATATAKGNSLSWVPSATEPYGTQPNCLSVKDNALWLEATDRVAAIDITLSGVKTRDVRLTLNGSRYQMLTRNTGDGVRVVIISPTGDLLSGQTKLLRLNKPASVTKAMAADTEARAVGVSFDDQTTGIGYIGEDGNGESASDSIYTIDGRKVEHTSPQGLYIVNGKKKAITRTSSTK